MAVLVYIENWEGSFKKQTKELLTYASDTAQLLDTDLVGLSIGTVSNAAIEELSTYGLAKVMTMDSPELAQFRSKSYAKAFSQAVSESGANVVILGNTYNGKSMGPRLAAQLDASIITGAISLPSLDNGFTVKKSVYSNKGFAQISLDKDVKIITLNVNSYEIKENPSTSELVSLAFESGANETVEITNVAKQTGKIPLTEAELVVSGGRGLKGPENWGMLEDLADKIGAGTACSKPVADVGWRPHNEHVGQTGITISPNLYIAVGISGAIQHLAGVSSSKVICVINKDPEAPFFQAADYGIVGDAFEVVPKLLEALKSID